MVTNVLLVDDEPHVTQAILRVFAKDIERGVYSFETAHNGVDALTKLQQDPTIDILLVDINMPKMDGLTLLAHLQTPTWDINPTLTSVIISGFGDMDTIRTAMNLGSFDFLLKPMQVTDLRATLSKTAKHVIQLKEAAKQSQLYVDATDKLETEIVERQQAVDALQESQRFIEKVADAMPSVLYVYDLQEKRDIYVNNRLTDVLGYTPQEAQHMGTDFLQRVMHPDDFAQFGARLARFERLNYGDIIETEYRMRHTNGEWRWFYARDTLFSCTDKGVPRQILGIAQDITESKLLETELTEVQHRLTVSQERERVRLAQELHDGPVQDLYSATYRLSDLNETLVSDVSQARLAAVQATVEQVIKTLRTICGELRPPSLAPFGLEKAIRSHAEQIARQHPHFGLTLNLDSDGQLLPEITRFGLFRIYQEMMNNVIRHAQAHAITITLTLTSDQTSLAVQDDGCGFTIPDRWVTLARQGHLGLLGAMERAETLGGKLIIESQPGNGTCIQVVAPRQ